MHFTHSSGAEIVELRESEGLLIPPNFTACFNSYVLRSRISILPSSTIQRKEPVKSNPFINVALFYVCDLFLATVLNNS